MKTQTNKLAGLTALTEKVAIYVPSTFDVDQKINNTSIVNEVIIKFSTLFGGATSLDVQGGWMSTQGGLVTEDVSIVYSFTDTLTDDVINEVVELAQWLKKAMKQEAISLEVNNKLYFV